MPMDSMFDLWYYDNFKMDVNLLQPFTSFWIMDQLSKTHIMKYINELMFALKAEI